MSDRKTPEADMSPIVVEWMEGQGLTVWSEVPMPGSASSIDHVGMDLSCDRVVACELKTGLTHNLLRQCLTRQLITDECYCVVSSNPRPSSVQMASRHGLGVIHAASQVKVLIEPHPQRPCRHVLNYYRDEVIKWCSSSTPGGIGGTPNLPGSGPAQMLESEIDSYRLEHPRATWKEIFENVPNHYCSAKSMAQGIRLMQRRREYKLREIEANQ